MEPRSLNSVGRVFDLDEIEPEILRTRPSGFARITPGIRHVHPLVCLKIGKCFYYGKNENVYIRLGPDHPLDFSTPVRFAESIFREDDGFVPQREFQLPAEPEPIDFTVRRSELPSLLQALDRIGDESRPEDIVDPQARRLFRLYRFRKENLRDMGGMVYENVFNHSGRDVVLEVLASVLGRLLDVRVPRNYAGWQWDEFVYPFASEPELRRRKIRSRWVLSRVVSGNSEYRTLADELGLLFREREGEADLRHWLAFSWKAANPLSLGCYEREGNASQPSAIREALERHFHRFPDIIRSDCFDQIVGGWRDRNLFEFILPAGREGPVYTVDYGEILFPEIALSPGEPGYLKKREAHSVEIIDYVERVARLDRYSPYRAVAVRTLGLFLMLSPGIFGKLLGRIPELFFRHGVDDRRYSCRPETIEDFFVTRQQLLTEWLTGSPHRDGEEIIGPLHRRFYS